jgi:hypothetical protein
MSLDKEALIVALRSLSENDARAIFNEARGQDVKTKQEKAAQALREWVGGPTIHVNEE